MQRDYKGFIFTKHALERLQDRSISQDAAAQVLQYPEITQPSDKPENVKFIKTINERTIHVVATYLADQKKWLVLSVWVRGEQDQPSLVWQLLTLPFKAVVWIFKRILKK